MLGPLAPGQLGPLGRAMLTGLILPPANQLLFYDPAYSYSDINLATPATDGGSVGSVADRGPGARKVVQSVSARQPTLRLTGINNRPSIQYATNQYLFAVLTAPILGNLNIYSLYVVMKMTDTTASTIVSEASSVINTQLVRIGANINATGNAESFHRDDANVAAQAVAAATITSGNARLLTLRRISAGSFALRSNGVQIATSTNSPGTTTTDRFGLGVLIRSSLSAAFVGHLAAVVAYNTDNFATIEPILNSYYNIF